MDFIGKTVVITGGSQGIGKQIAESFAIRKADVAILDINEASVESVAEEFRKLGYSCRGYCCDVTCASRVGEVFKAVYQESGRIDILINNAGITKDNLILRMKESDWDAVINVNLKGTFNCIQKASRYLIKQSESSIINIASVIGVMGNKGQSNYAASKAGIIGLTKSVAKEFAVRNLRCNAIAPGFIRTAMTDRLPEEVAASYAEAIPLQRMGTAADVANICLFLGSELSSYVTGQVINVDGGLLM